MGILRYLLIALVAWMLRDILNAIAPIPTEGMMQSFMEYDPANPTDQKILFGLRFSFWIILIDLIIRFARPAFGFILPTAASFSVTKPMRRVQGVFAEIVLLALIFLVVAGIGSAVLLPWEISAETDKRMEQTRNNLIFSATKNVKTLYSQAYNQASMGNQWISSEIDRTKSYRRPMVGDMGWFGITDSDGNLHHPDRHPQYFQYKSGWGTVSSYGWGNSNKAEYYITLGEGYKTYKSNFQQALNQYNAASNSLSSDTTKINRQYKQNPSQDYKSTHGVFKSVVWSHFQISPMVYLKPAFNSVKVVALVVAIILYLLTHLPIRYDLANKFESVLRVFEQSRFGKGGAARFAGLLEEWTALLANQKFGLFLGRSLYNPYLKIGSEDPRHMLTIAGTRAGKGATAIIPNLLIWKGSALVIDPKGTNAKVTARRRRDMGQQVYIIDPFNIVNDVETDAFNPLAALDPESPDIREHINTIAEALVVPDPEQKEKHWDDGAKTIISGLLGHLISSGDYESPSLPMIREMLALPPDSMKELWVDMMMNTGAGRLPVDTASRVLRGIETNEIAGILSNADKHTEWLSSPAMRKALTKSTFDFGEIKDKPTTVYLVLPPKELVNHKRFLRLFINLALTRMSTGGRAKVPVLFLMDEFLSLGKMEEVEKAFGLLAGYNLVMWPFIQDLGSLKNLYGGGFNAFINNSRAVQVFGVSDLETTGFVSERLGERSVEENRGPNKAKKIVKLRTPSEIAIDVSGESKRQYILRSGKAPFLIEKVPYYQEKMFATMYDADPDYT